MTHLKKLEEEQLKLAKKVILKDSFEKLELIGGVEQSYTNSHIISAIVVCDYKTMEPREKVYGIARPKIPYVAGFRAYREGPSISEAYMKLSLKPDVLLFNGNGILHPRKCGLASHMGILLDQATIGIAQKLLLGDIKNNKVYIGNDAVAESFITREHARPVYISPGHKISLRTSVEIVKNCLRPPHKMPEPLHTAHRYAKEVKEKIEKGEIKF